MVIVKDLFDIADRLKNINPNYFVVQNDVSKKYELHHHLKRPTYVLTFPQERLDERAIIHTLKTRVERLEKLIEEIEENNLLIEKKAKKEAKESIYNAIDSATSKII